MSAQGEIKKSVEATRRSTLVAGLHQSANPFLGVLNQERPYVCRGRE